LNYSPSRQLIENTQPFFEIKYYSAADRLLNRCGTFYGWGRKRSGQKAMELSRKCGTPFVLLEDGFIRSVGLGVDGSPAFSIVEDDVGIYYDATAPSRLENLLNSYDFAADEALMAKARKAMELMRKHRVSKYNHAPDIGPAAFSSDEKRVLVVAQTAGDASLRYGLAERFTTDEMIDAAIAENPGAQVYLKVHPDVLSGKKRSDIDVGAAREKCTVIEEDVNPVSLLEHFDKVYTKTSQMGFEALLLGKACVCFGMPFYAGWGVTDDRVGCERRKRRLGVEEIFAAAYILYARYYNPYTKQESDIIDTIGEIVKRRQAV
jgi:capsular polysaccharide export protein